MSDKQTNLLNLRLIAAKAAKLADDLEKGRLWDGDLTTGVQEILRSLNEIQERAK